MGYKGTKIHNSWRGMRERCNNPNHKHYKHYGGRGIKVCEEWNNSFHSFLFWSNNNGYAEGLSIDRKDNDGNYEPDNCRWANAKTQNRNSRHNILVVINGVTKALSQWAEEHNLTYGTLKWRYYQGLRGLDLIAPITRYSIEFSRRNPNGKVSICNHKSG
jgi:hypothetical protein